MKTKICIKCGEQKAVNEYYSHRHMTDGRLGACRVCCIAARRLAHANRDVESHRRKKRAYHKVYGPKQKDWRMRKLYGLSLDQYNALVKKQKGRCLICLAKEADFPQYRPQLLVDHCHQSKKVRGLLCDYCNKGLGYFRDNVGLMENAIKYIQRAVF